MYTNAIGELVVKTRAANVSERVTETTEDFRDTMKHAEEEAGVQKAAKLKRDAEYEDESKKRQRKLMEMRSRIAELKAMIKEPGTDEVLESELSLLQMELFWYMTKL